MKRTYFLPDDYIRIVTKIYGKERLGDLNCLAFALGDTRPDDKNHLGYNLNRYDADEYAISISSAFEWECYKRGIEVKRVQNAESGHRYFRLYGWYDCGDFHIVRQEPDGTLVHKLGWMIAPTITSDEALQEEYPEPYILYRVEEE